MIILEVDLLLVIETGLHVTEVDPHAIEVDLLDIEVDPLLVIEVDLQEESNGSEVEHCYCNIPY